MLHPNKIHMQKGEMVSQRKKEGREGRKKGEKEQRKEGRKEWKKEKKGGKKEGGGREGGRKEKGKKEKKSICQGSGSQEESLLSFCSTREFSLSGPQKYLLARLHFQKFLGENPDKQRAQLPFHTTKEKPLASVNSGCIVLKQGQALLSKGASEKEGESSQKPTSVQRSRCRISSVPGMRMDILMYNKSEGYFCS